MTTHSRPRAATRAFILLGGVVLLVACHGNDIAGCDIPTPPDGAPSTESAIRIVNGVSTPIDVLVDGKLFLTALNAGAVDTLGVTLGQHTVTVKYCCCSHPTSVQSVTTASGALPTIAAYSTGYIASLVLDDTNNVVPTGATKLRVVNLLENSELRVYRTQPDNQQPTPWPSAFFYVGFPTSSTTLFYQSTPGTWDVRAWVPSTAADSMLNWDTTSVRVQLPLASGEKRTILILPKLVPGPFARMVVL